MRAEFEARRGALKFDHLVFLDESGMRLGEGQRYRWAPREKRVYGSAKHAPWKTVTMIGAMAADGIRAFVNIEATTTGDVFRGFVEQHLARTLQVGDCVVMDNLSAHKDRRAIEVIRQVGATVLVLPPYSPDWNPIEKLWSKIKEFVRRQVTDTRPMFDDEVGKAIGNIKTSDLLGWIRHCGYEVTSH